MIGNRRKPDASPLTRLTPFDDVPEFLSPKEFADYLGLSRSTVYDMLNRDEIPHCRFGRTVRIPKTALQSIEPT